MKVKVGKEEIEIMQSASGRLLQKQGGIWEPMLFIEIMAMFKESKEIKKAFVSQKNFQKAYKEEIAFYDKEPAYA